jgi:hypothetical protein
MGPRLALSLVGASSLLLAAAAPAATKKKAKAQPIGALVERSASVVVSGANLTTGTVTATCPGKRKAVSGGFTTASTPNSNLLVYETARAGARGWKASGVISTGGSQHTLTSHVYCQRGPALKAVATAGTTPLGSTGTFGTGAVESKCPKGTSAVAGGFAEPAPDGVRAGFITESFRPARRSWRVVFSGSSGVGPESQTVTVTAYCAAGKRSGGAASVPVGAGGTATAIAPNCSRRVAGGGFSNPFLTSPSSLGVITETRRFSPTQWQVRTQGLGGPLTLTAFGYCA